MKFPMCPTNWADKMGLDMFHNNVSHSKNINHGFANESKSIGFIPHVGYRLAKFHESSKIIFGSYI